VGPANASQEDKDNFYATCFEVLVTLSKVLAPIAPFISEEIYKNLTGKESVHLADWPGFKSKLVNRDLEKDMVNAMLISSMVHEQRKINNLKVKIPLISLDYSGPKELDSDIVEVIKEEANVREMIYKKNKVDEWSITGDFGESNQDIKAGEARDIIRSIQAERKNLGTELSEKVDVELPDWPQEFEAEIKRKALVENLKKADEFRVIRVNA